MVKFEKVNITGNKNSGDCVIQSIALFLNESWDNVYNNLCEIGFKIKRVPTDFLVFKTYLNKLGYDFKTLTVKKGETRLRVGDIKGTALARIANHLTYVEKGILKDKWDCRKKAIYRIIYKQRDIKEFTE